MRRKFFSAGRFISDLLQQAGGLRKPARELDCPSTRLVISPAGPVCCNAGSTEPEGCPWIVGISSPEGSPRLLRDGGPAWAQSGPLTKSSSPLRPAAAATCCAANSRNIFPRPLTVISIAENRTGADGLIGIRAVKGAAPDTTTILVTTGPTMYLLPMVENTPSFELCEGFSSRFRSLSASNSSSP